MKNSHSQILLMLFISLCFTGLVTAQKIMLQEQTRYNLPPGAKFYAKKFNKIDYSYKLNSAGDLPVERQFLKFSEEELNTLKFKNVKQYNYYVQAKDFFTCLSDKVKRNFTNEELWYVYIYDQELKEQLTLIK